MKEADFRKTQECVADLIRVKDELAKGMHKMYRAYIDAGFTKEEAMILLKEIVKGGK